MPLPLEIAAESFNPPAGGELDFDVVGAPRQLRPRPVGANGEAEGLLRADLAWFWNSNADWADDQIAVGETYPPLVRRLVETVGLQSGERVVLSASEPDARREVWRNALPPEVLVSEWRPRRPGGLALDDLAALTEGGARLVVLTKACPVTGALNEIIPVAQFLAGTGAVLVTEASHFLSHGSLDIRNLRCDAVIAGGEEFFGARGAALWARRLKSAPEESGNGAAGAHTVAGLARAVSYVERLGGARGAPVAPPSERFGRREPMRRGMQSIREAERVLSRLMLRGLGRLPGVTVLGEAAPARAAYRLPTFTFTPDEESPAALAAALAAEGVRVGSGDLGCAGVLAALGFDPEAGAVRASLAHYHTPEDVARFLRVLGSLL